MIRKGLDFRRAPSLTMASCAKHWKETEKVKVNGKEETVWKHIRYTGGRRDGERIENNYCVPIRIYRKRPNKRAVEVRLPCTDGEKRTFFTLPEPVDGHSRTNMPYGTTKQHKDGSKSSKVYWMEDGCVFSTSSTWWPEEEAA